MAGTRLSVKMPQVLEGQEGEEDTQLGESMVVEIPASSKFGFAWPAEQPSPAVPPAAERPVALSSSDGETDQSEDELSAPVRRQPKPEEFSEESEYVTPTSRLNIEQNPMDQAGRHPALPRLSRAFSMPLPSQLNSLQNPRRNGSSGGRSPASDDSPVQLGHFQELSLELADSVQMVIQTLLQLSPPQVLDPAKEHLSACSLSIPTPSISAMFTSLKNLNYMSANMYALGSESSGATSPDVCTPEVPPIFTVQNDFDVGEMLQSVGDAMSGIAATAGVDLVLFHGDVGMKHLAVRGDEDGLSYTLTHVLRQVIGCAAPGDTIEVGLLIEAQGDPHYDHSEAPDRPSGGSSSPSLDDEGFLRCVFHIHHRFATGEPEHSSETASQGPQDEADRSSPALDSIILNRLVRHICAQLNCDVSPKGLSSGRAYELVVPLEQGDPHVVNSSMSASSEDAAILGFPDLRIADEPTMEQLLQFSETLKGKSVTLYANSKGSFAHHLSSYLTAWGMNVSHMSTEPGVEGEYACWGEEQGITPVASLGVAANGTDGIPESSPSTERRPQSDLAFILIDDDVAVLRSRLQKIRAEQYPLTLHTRKRPSLASNHRPRSSPQVTRVMGMTGATPPQSQVVIVHFTSLSNFKLVKDAVQTMLASGPGGPSSRIPEVIVIPKPAGPRRFLTALHTAVTKPVVDPFFMPTATSPMSPGLHAMSPFSNFTTSAPKSPGARSTTSVRTTSDRPARSPKEFGGEPTSTSISSLSQHPPSPLARSETREYFTDAIVKLGASPATGFLIQSPDGQPAGIFFHPKGRTPSGATLPPTPSPKLELANNPNGDEPTLVRHKSSRVPSGSNEHGNSESVATSSGGALTMQADSSSSLSVASSTTETSLQLTTTERDTTRRMSTSREESAVPRATEQGVVASVPASPEVAARGFMIRRPSSQVSNASATAAISPSSSPQRSPVNGTPTVTRRRKLTESSSTDVPSGSSKKGKTGKSESNIVPPISVLIVDDNPINQTILSTFMRRKKIKYDVAKNGEEAVQKWRSGAFHLILMDIQMPVMDGIQATKEIRRIEKLNAGYPSTPQSEGQRTPSDVSTTDSRTVSTPAYRSSVIIVALTASSLQADRVAALAAGCNDFLTKPVSLDWLNSKIIEWGSIKALQMWAEIRPEVVKSISTGQAAQAQQIARKLHVPEGRSASTPGGTRSGSPAAVKKRTRGDSGGVQAMDRVGTLPESLDGAAAGLGITIGTDAPAPSPNTLANISAMEAAMTLAAHRPQIPVADVQIPTEAIVSAVEAAVPILPPDGAAAMPPAATEAMDVRVTPNGSNTAHEPAGDPKASDPSVQSDKPPEQPQSGPH